MRAYDGQISGNRPLRRSREEKLRQLRDLRETLAGMKSHVAPALRQSVQKRIAALELELDWPSRRS